MSGARPPPQPARLRPPQHAFPVVERHRLVDAVEAGVRAAPITLLQAPAGTGKTVLAAAWAGRSRRGMPPAWLTLGDGDDRPGVFWSHVVAALARTGAVVDGAPDPARDVDPAFVERLAAELLTHRTPVALVLDEAERLTDRRIGRQLDHLLRAAGPRFRLVVVSRTDPALPLHRYRLDGTVAQVRYADLAFTPAEVGTLLELHGVRAPELTRIVADRTEGWAAAVRFAALALQERPPAGRDSGDGGVGGAAELRASLVPAGSVLGEYLAAEVLEALPPAHLDFLVRTSVAAELSPGLAEALTGRRDGERLLAALARGDAFVLPVPGAAGRYRTHPLVRELLGTVLAKEHPGEAGELHRRAARWCAASGQVTEAVDHLVAAGDWAGAASVVVDRLALAPLLVPTAGTALARRLEPLPEDVDTPAVAVVQAALALRRGDPRSAARRLSRCDEYLASADVAGAAGLAGVAGLGGLAGSAGAAANGANGNGANGVGANGNGAGANGNGGAGNGASGVGRVGADGGGLVLAVAATRTVLADAVGDAGATLAAAGYLLDLLRSGPAADVDRGRYSDLRALALLCAGTARLRAGDPAAACADLADALAGDDGDQRENDCGAAIRLRALAMLSLAEASRGRLSKAQEVAAAAEALAADNTVAAADRPAAAHLARAWVALQRQELPGAQHWLRRAVRIPAAQTDPLLSSIVALLQVRVRHDQGDTDGARRLLAGPAAGPDAGPAWVRALLGAEAAAVAAGGRGTSIRRAPGRRAIVAAFRPPGVEPQAARVEQLLQQAHRQLGRGDAEASRAAVVRALALARREQLRRPFTHVSPQLRWLIRTDAVVSAKAGWLRPAATAPAAQPGQPAQPGRRVDDPPPVGRALSGRELEVLRHLSSLLTTEEVAAAMYISVNTVRTHIRGILRKLSASRRNEAVRRARHLGIV